MLVMFVMQMVLTYGRISLIYDRLGGRLRKLSAAPVRPVEIYGGKIVARMGIACAQATVLLGCGAAIFHLFSIAQTSPDSESGWRGFPNLLATRLRSRLGTRRHSRFGNLRCANLADRR
jgi:ABC-type Na+ efflux pump permease subunit